jgi:hypothetical protein
MALGIWEINWLGLDQLVHLRIVVVAGVEGRETDNHLVRQNAYSPPVNREGVTFFI